MPMNEQITVLFSKRMPGKVSGAVGGVWHKGSGPPEAGRVNMLINMLSGRDQLRGLQ
jgi:hypothetical protein